MNTTQAIRNIKTAINGAARNDYIAEFHLQIIKRNYAFHKAPSPFPKG